MFRSLIVAALVLAAAVPTAARAETPAVTASATPARGAAPLVVTLRADGEAASYHWDLGDGSRAEGRVVEHRYARPGRYVARVTASAADGATATAEVAVTAVALTLAAPRTAAFGQAARFTGTIRPATAGLRIALVRGGAEVAAARTDARGAFAISARVTAPGAFVARSGDVLSPPQRVAVQPLLEARIDGTRLVGQPLRLVASLRPAAAGTLRVEVVRDGRRTYAGSHRGAARISLASNAPRMLRIAVRLVPAAGYAGAARTLTATVVEPELSLGSRGPGVLALERRLAELRYALPRVDAHFGVDTYQAVLAFQKVHGLPRTGRVDARVWRELGRAQTPPPRFRGTHIEVSKGRQLLYVVRDGEVRSIVHVSTGATGNTPVGTWRIYRKVTGWDWILWYPMYFLRGFAIHGYPDVPSYPASRGCVRLPMWFAPELFSRFTYGQLVRVY